MVGMPWEEQIKAHLEAKPFSIDPFGEVGISDRERDALLISDFMESYGALSKSVAEKINGRYTG